MVDVNIGTAIYRCIYETLVRPEQTSSNRDPAHLEIVDLT